MRIHWSLAGMVLVGACLAVARTAEAGIIADVFGSVGPGLGVAAFDTQLATPNNDNANPPVKDILDELVNSGEIATSFNGIFATKVFESVAPIDTEFLVRNSQGTTEYLALEVVGNLTGKTWNDYHFELGFGTDKDFVPSTSDDGLNFDTPDRDPTPLALTAHADSLEGGDLSIDDTPAFSSLNHMDDAIWWTGGAVSPLESLEQSPLTLSLFTFSLDTPDLNDQIPESARTEGGYRFTLRQLPSVEERTGQPVVPEPTNLALVGLGLTGLGAAVRFRRRKYLG